MNALKSLSSKSYLEILGVDDRITEHDKEFYHAAEILATLESIILELQNTTYHGKKSVHKEFIDIVTELAEKESDNQFFAVALSYKNDAQIFLEYIKSAWYSIASKIHLAVVDTNIILSAFEAKMKEFEHYFIKGVEQ